MMKISPSQIQDKRDCMRKWFFAHRLRLPSIKKSYFAFGSILHEVCARWLRADENGRDQNGKAVELYPEGWETFTEKDGTSQTITKDEQILIKDLVQLAIEQGVLERLPGRKIEEYFAREVIDDVILHGIMDVQTLDECCVEDHKTSKSIRYALSEEKLQHDIKMRCYAIEVALRYFQKYQKTPNVIQMILNYMIKDPLKPKAFRRIAHVSIDELEGEWERIQADAKDMKLWAEKYEKYVDKAKKGNYTSIDHEEIPGPEKTDICNQYGGCPYQTICTGRETVHQYFKRVDQILHPKLKEKNTMGSIFQERLKQIQESKGVKVFGVNLEEKKKKEDFVPASPPWTNPECTKCKDHPGLDEHGEACPICFKLAKKAGLPLPPECVYNKETNAWTVYKETPDDEAIPVMGQDGNLKEAKDKSIPTPVPQEEPKEESKKVRKLRSNSLSKAVEKQQQQTEEPSEEQEVQQVEEQEQSKGGKQLGRPPMGFTLCIGAVPLRSGTREVLYVEQLLDKAKEMISAELKQDYENQDPFQRRDMAALAVRSMATSFGASIIVAPDSHCLTPDLRAIVEELKVNAQTIFVSAGY